MKAGKGGEDSAGKTIIAGGSFIRASYRISPLGEDLKNAIIALFQFIPSGQKMSGRVLVDSLEDLVTIHTEYGDVTVARAEHPVNRRLQQKYIFTVPMQFFIKGRRSDGRYYREVEEALHALASCRFTFVDSSDGMRHTTNTGIINDPETLSPLQGADGRNTIVSFSMTRTMLETIFNATYGFYKFVEPECRRLTSIYAKRMYEILCGQKPGACYRMDVDRFKNMFCITGKYTQTSDLVRRVLSPVRDEINALTSLTIDFFVERSVTNPKGRVITFRILRNAVLQAEHEVAKRYILWPEARLDSFLRETVGMRKGEMRPHLSMLYKASRMPALMDELPRKWEKTCERIPQAGTDRISREVVRRSRVAHFIATLKGMMEDYGAI
ncbi:MAG: RepB family plasmid replication initiator protein [Candidatus Cryptobacteroides sp.]